MQFYGMDDITNIQDDNLGGLSTIRFAPVYFFATLNPLAFKAGFAWISLECTTETMAFNEKTVDDANGGYQNTAIGGTIPKIRPAVHATLQKYRLHPCIVECEDNNGYLRRAGLSGTLILLDQATTGTAVTDENGYGLQFTGAQKKPALFI